MTKKAQTNAGISLLISTILLVAYCNCSKSPYIHNLNSLDQSSSVPVDNSPMPTGDTTDLTLLKNFVQTQTAPGQWAEIPNSKMRPNLITQAEVNAIDPRIWAVSGSPCVILCWTSSAFDGRNWYFGPGGGHNGYNGNEIYRFSLSTLTWKRLYDPSPLQAAPEGTQDVPPVWGSTVPHNYDGNIYSPKTRSIFIFNGFAEKSWEYKIDEPNPQKAWTSFQSASQAGLKGFAYTKTALLANGNIFVALSGDHNPAEFDVVTKTFTRWHPWSFASASYTVADTSTKNNNVYYMSTYGTGSVTIVDTSKTPLAGTTLPNSSPPSFLGDGACFIYHPPSNRFLAWRDGRKVAVFDPEAITWTVLDNPNGAAPTPAYNPNGPYQKCIYVPELDIFLFNNDDTQNIWSYRL